MARQSQRWKQLERDTASSLGGRRVVRGGDFSVSDVDVEVPDLPKLKVDCKAYASFRHHALLDELYGKYCKDGDVPVLVTKASRQIGSNVTVPMWFFQELLHAYRVVYVPDYSSPFARSLQSNQRSGDLSADAQKEKQ